MEAVCPITFNPVVGTDRHDDVAIDFAMCMDARSCLFGFLKLAHSAGTAPQEELISPSPPARVSMMVGRNETSIVSELKADLFGLITLGKENENERASSFYTNWPTTN